VSGARRAWGWHQLDPRWAELIVAGSGVRRGDLVVEVGAGLGALTRPLLATGAHVIAFERHPGRAADLRASLGTEFGTELEGVPEGVPDRRDPASRGGRLTVVEADAADMRLPRRPFHVVANPPFAISAPVLRRLLHPGSRLTSAHLVLQDQVVRRWSGPDAPAARRWQQTFVVEAGRPVPPSAFHPPPRVRCRLLVIRRR
jgi:23S rRNA (adenine-N6)-dimethyltransferase